MDISFDIPTRTTLALDDVDAMLMVCSHERSGTHFLMNSLASCTRYVGNPWLNYDLMPFGGVVNFFFESSVRDFFANISRFEGGGAENLGIASIVKSHFPLSMVQCALDTGLRIAYIYRNPVDTLLSFWRLLHGFSWFEGPKLATPLELAQHVPCGQSQRYQLLNCESYFDRWAMHVSDAVHVAAQSSRVVLVSYEELVASHAPTVSALTDRLGIARESEPVYPSRESDVIAGTELAVSDQAMQELRDYCLERAGQYPGLPAGILDKYSA